ncbi:MAG: amidohydrolase family protein, partial [Thermoplasmata archaeon]|nr:amidohydrolase family protein [Thermoplasmata archaeon]
RVKLVFGSDCMPFSPIYGLASAVAAPHDVQRLTVEEALAAYTRDAAYTSFEENVKGVIAEGKLADFVVLSRNPFDDPSDIRSIQVVKTVVGGEVVYDRMAAKER